MSKNTVMKYIDQLQAFCTDNSQLAVRFPFFNDIDDTNYLVEFVRIADILRAHKPEMVIVCGIGGSSAGAKTVLEFVSKQYIVDTPIIYFADTIDSEQSRGIRSHMRSLLLRSANVCVIAVSKSGKTMETIVNFSVFVDILAEIHQHTWQRYCLVISEDDSPLTSYAQKNGIITCDVPREVSGRYSLFTAAGLLPLLLMSLDVTPLLAGARVTKEQFLQKKMADVYTEVAQLYDRYCNGLRVWDTFLFSENLISYGRWWKQLIAESLGKQTDLDGKDVASGFLPTVSVGVRDLHSQIQLYLSSNVQRYTSFVHIVHTLTDDILVSRNNELVALYAGKTYTQLVDAALHGTMDAYKAVNLPYTHVAIKDKCLHNLGAVMMRDMITTVLLAHLMNINPFDQPAVELYKRAMRNNLQN